MSATILSSPSHRDLAVLRSVAAGRCGISPTPGVFLTIDGLGCCDQFAAARLVRAGLIAAAGPAPERARLTRSGQELLDAA
jgi:hypothetical protein